MRVSRASVPPSMRFNPIPIRPQSASSQSIALRAWRSVALRPTSRIVSILVLMVVIFASLRFSYFFTVDNIRNIGTNASVLVVMAVGMTYVMVSAGIDISVGAVLIFSGVVSAKVMISVGGDSVVTIGIGLLCALAAGAAWGVVNGTLVAKAGLPSLIVTLGTLGMAEGLAYVLTGGVDIVDIPQRLASGIGASNVLGVPWLVLIAAAVAVILGVVLARTRFGRYTYAIGSNAEAARRSGINVHRHLIWVYGLMGLLSGLAGWLALALFDSTTIDGHATDNLLVITAVVLGGTSLFGGIGTVLGSVIGVLIPAVLQNGFVILDVDPFWQYVAVGAILIVAVYLDHLGRQAAQASG